MFTRRHVLHGAGLATLALALTACAEPGGAREEDLKGASAVLTLPLDGTPHVEDAATASSRIAWQLMVADGDIRTSNAAMSPSSLAVTLAMLTEGATGDSLTSLDRTFGLTGDERSAAIGALRQALAVYEGLPAGVDVDDPPDKPVVHLANRVVILDDAEISQQFLDRLSSYYDTGATRLPGSTAKANLDAWAKRNTAGLIKESGIVVTPGLRLVTQDAVLFAARWRQGFMSDEAPLSFTKDDGEVVEMKALASQFAIPHATGQGWAAIRLPYDDVLAMDVVLPESGVHPTDLDFEAINASIDALSSAEEQLVDVIMPPSDITSKWDLLEPLEMAGVDLTEMNGIFPGAETEQFAQQVRLMVSAKGTVGAALTETAVDVSAPAEEPSNFVVDRPFFMRVLDIRTGWPFLVAVVSDPAGSRA